MDEITKAERFRRRFISFLNKYRLEHVQEAQNLLRDTMCWLNARPASPALCVTGFFPPALTELIQQLADPASTEAMLALQDELATMRDEILRFNQMVEALQKDNTILSRLS